MKKIMTYGLLLTALVTSFSAYAATVITMNLGELVNVADDIVVARSADIRSRWLGNKIVTDNVFEVTERVKGSANATLTITTLGGTAMHPSLNAPINMAVPGGVVFERGEEALVFTKANALGQNQLVGLTQGKFAIETDPESGKKLIAIGQKTLTTKVVGADDLDYFFSPSAVFEPHGNTIEVRKMELNELIYQIKQLLN